MYTLGVPVSGHALPERSNADAGKLWGKSRFEAHERGL
jgi:hypothetical protein